MSEQAATEKTKRLSLKLDDRTVSIDPAEWPEIGGNQGEHECGQYGQNGKTWWRVHIRQHEDGRTVVYLRSGGGCQCNLPFRSGGELMPSFDRDQVHAAVARLIELGHECTDVSADPDEVAEDIRRTMQDLPEEKL